MRLSSLLMDVVEGMLVGAGEGREEGGGRRREREEGGERRDCLLLHLSSLLRQTCEDAVVVATVVDILHSIAEFNCSLLVEHVMQQAEAVEEDVHFINIVISLLIDGQFNGWTGEGESVIVCVWGGGGGGGVLHVDGWIGCVVHVHVYSLSALFSHSFPPPFSPFPPSLLPPSLLPSIPPSSPPTLPFSLPPSLSPLSRD